MVGTRSTTSARRARGSAARGSDEEPDVYQQMLTEAGVATGSESPAERPLKRRRPTTRVGGQPASTLSVGQDRPFTSGDADVKGHGSDDDSGDIEFEDVEMPEPTVQTMELNSDDDGDDDNEELEFEDIDFTSAPKEKHADKPAELELNLSAQQAATTPMKRAAERRKPISKEEREMRIEIHKMHLLCLLSHVSRRNHWCNDAEVQRSLRPHLTEKSIDYLNPSSRLTQFGQAESLKTGLKQSGELWKARFKIRERGLRRALWAEDAEQLKDYEPPADMDSCLDRKDFREAARKLQGSRDAGAQLYCALLRSVGVRARLVCSLQPLSFLSASPTLPKAQKKAKASKSQTERHRDAVAKYQALTDKVSSASSSSGSTVRRRLGHPNATAYNFQPPPPSPRAQHTFENPVKIHESPYPVYWVEVLDIGHQKWQPADPVVLHSFWKPSLFEPPISDRENCLSYVVAFDEDGVATDVTRRYAKAYTAKTRRLRVDHVLNDEGRWWGKATKLFRPRRNTDLDQIENNELAGAEAREPMPRNVQDFKDHPVFALERHLRRHEVLVPGATPSGTVGAGGRGPLEKIYRRRDVRIARSGDKWYRLGREVKPNEIPAKWLPKKARPNDSRYEGEDARADEDAAGTPIYTVDQTELYEPPPVRNGRVPKNKFGNVEVFVPSMVPRGAIHVVHEHAVRAACLLGADFAPALTGFQFQGRQGTAMLQGIVVAAEFGEAIQAVVEGLGDVQQEMEEQRRSAIALRMWRRLLTGLRIRERIWSNVDEEERKEADRQAAMDAELDNAESDVTEEFGVEVDGDDDLGGGFLVE